MTNAVARRHVPAWYQGYMRGILHTGMAFAILGTAAFIWALFR